jgi:endonuclease YncB( thermonuclease family)
MPRGKVKRIIDGDTFQLKGGEYVRIAGLDAPELHQRGGMAAKRRLQSKVPQGKQVGLSMPVAKSYGRVVRKVTINQKNVIKLVTKSKSQRRRK